VLSCAVHGTHGGCALANERKARQMESWLRRVVPAGYAEATLILQGTSPLLMNSGDADVDSELYRSYVLLGQKRGKSLDDEARLRELEWQLRLYLDEDLGPFIPGKNVKELLRSAATKWRKGEEIKRSLIVVLNRIPLDYKGPRDQAGLWKAGFRYTTMVANAGAGSGRVRRCRPMFDGWGLVAEIAYDPEDLDFDTLCLVAERTQKYGLGDYRPTFGSFSSRLVQGKIKKNGVNGSATKKADPVEEGAHAAFRERIMTQT
jgi:hypothetical protein